MNKIIVLLADPPTSNNMNPYAISFPNLGLLYLISYLRKHFESLEIYYIDGSYSFCDHIKKVKELSPDIYGISISSPLSIISYNIIEMIKREIPDLFIICGGPHPTADAEHVLLNSKADICCLGEGEATLLQIIQFLKNGYSINNIDGIAFKDHLGKVTFNSPRELIKDINIIPFPAWDLIDFTKYSGCRKTKGKISTAIVASRGCPYKCVFCSNPVWRRPIHDCRLRDPENIVSEILILYKLGIREIYIRSDEMNIYIEWAISVFNALASLNLKDLHFQCNLRADKVTTELAYAMNEAGCWLTHIGVESGSNRVLKGIKKGITVSDILKATNILKEHKIKVYAFTMLYQLWETGNRLYIETTMEVIGTLLFILKMRFKGLINHMSWGFAIPYPGSELNAICIKYQIKSNYFPNHKEVIPHDIVLQLPGISLLQLKILRSLGIILQALLFIFSLDSYNVNTLQKNIKHACFKLKYIIAFQNFNYP